MLENLVQYCNMIAPGLHHWQRDCPQGTELEVWYNRTEGTLEFRVNGETVARLREADFVDGSQAITQAIINSTRYKMLVRAWEMEKELAPIRAAAPAKSEALLRKHLTEAQRETLDREGWFEVIGGYTGSSYRVYKDLAVHGGRNVVASHDGHPAVAYGATPHGNGRQLPWGDVLLAQKLALECNESEFRSTACKAAIVNGSPLVGNLYWPGIMNNAYPENLEEARFQAVQMQAPRQLRRQANLEHLNRLVPRAYIQVRETSVHSPANGLKNVAAVASGVIIASVILIKLTRYWFGL